MSDESRICPMCKKVKDKKDFVRCSSESGIIENNFVYCNECLGYK